MSEFVERPTNKRSLAKRKLVQGVGINDAPYITEYCIDGRRVFCPYYSTWSCMLKRCYSASVKTKYPTYKGCSVVNEWFRFSNFKAWMKEQDWQGKMLDKDILEPGNKTYSPNTCMFVTHKVNTLLGKSQESRGQYPQGVSWHKRILKFHAQCCVNGVKKSLGYFINCDEAAAKYNTTKAREIRRVASLQADIRIKDALLAHAELRATA